MLTTRHHTNERSALDECVDIALVRFPFTHPLDVEAEEVEPVGHVHHARLGLRQAQPEQGENLTDLRLQRLDVVVFAADRFEVGLQVTTANYNAAATRKAPLTGHF